MGRGFFAGCLLLAGCSIKHLAVNRLGDALAGSGDTFASDDDPELIRSAVPFSLKLIESLLRESPSHPGLLLAASSGFAQYTYAFVQSEADYIEDTDVAAATALRLRARRLYLRARGYGFRGLELRHPGFEAALRAEPEKAVARLAASDVPQMYWTAATWASAISVSKDQPDLIAELPLVEALVDRALTLDESFNFGAIHALMIPLEMSRPGAAGKASDRAERHFERAMALSKGAKAGPLVSLAETVAVDQQDRARFQSLLDQALAIPLDAHPEFRLENTLGQKRARWLLAHADALILPANR